MKRCTAPKVSAPQARVSGLLRVRGSVGEKVESKVVVVENGEERARMGLKDAVEGAEGGGVVAKGCAVEAEGGEGGAEVRTRDPCRRRGARREGAREREP